MRLPQRPVESVGIDIAPLIDMVFQLLIFFMLTSSFVLHPGIQITLPKAATSQSLTASHVVITLTREHVVYLDEEQVTIAELRRKLKSAGTSKPVLIRSDRHAYVEKLIALWDLCRETGFREVHIATLPE